MYLNIVYNMYLCIYVFVFYYKEPIYWKSTYRMPRSLRNLYHKKQNFLRNFSISNICYHYKQLSLGSLFNSLQSNLAWISCDSYSNSWTLYFVGFLFLLYLRYIHANKFPQCFTTCILDFYLFSIHLVIDLIISVMV